MSAPKWDRLKPRERELIDRTAEEALLDRTIFAVSPEAYAEFLARLEAPVQPNERLRRTMRTRVPWDPA